MLDAKFSTQCVDGLKSHRTKGQEADSEPDTTQRLAQCVHICDGMQNASSKKYLLQQRVLSNTKSNKPN